MPEQDALSTFDFSKVTGSGLYVKFEPGKPLTLRVLTVDPVVTNESYEDRKTGETIMSTRFSFIVYNFTEEKAQIWKATANTGKQLGILHTDADFGANIRKIDLKITAPNKGEIKAYDIQVLPSARELTQEQIKECAAINLDEKVENGQRMSYYKPEEKSGYEKAKEAAQGISQRAVPANGGDKEDDIVIEDVGEEPINLDDIPF